MIPVAIDALDRDELVRTFVQLLDDSAGWPTVRADPGVTLRWGQAQVSPFFYYRSETEHPVAAERVKRFFFDEHPASLERLTMTSGPGGYQLVTKDVLAQPDADTKLVLLEYRLPAPMAPRDFLYIHHHRQLANGSAVVISQSVAGQPPRRGHVRGLLPPVGVRIRAEGDQRTRLEYAATSEMGGWMKPWVLNYLLRSAVLRAGRHESRKFCELLV